MPRFPPFFIALALAVTLCGCGGGSNSTPLPPEATGFRGVVRERLDSGEVVPIPNTTVLISEWYGDSEQITSGAVVARTTTDAEGRFSVSVPAGWYEVSSPFPAKYADGCQVPSQIWIEKLPEGKISSNVTITQTGCR